MKRTLSLLMTVVLLVLAVVAAVPSAFASAVDLAASAYSLAAPSFKVERGAKGILVTWNADSGVDHYRVYHKTADGWSKVADNIKVGYYFDTSVVKGKSYTFTVRGLNSSDSFVTDFNRNGVSVTFTPDPDKYLLGDTDMDGMVTVMDSTHIQRKLAELKTDEYKYINYLGDSDNDGLNITDATRIQRYIAQIPIPYPVGGKLLGLSGAPTEAPTQAPTEVVVDAPKSVSVTEGSSGKKEYAEVVKYGYCTNLMNSGAWINAGDTPTSFWKSQVENDQWVSTRLEQLGNGKVRFYFNPVAKDKVTSIITVVRWGEGDKDFSRVDATGDALKLGYCDHQLPVVSTTNPSIKVSWGESSNADSYEVRALDAKGNAVFSVVRTGSTSATVTLNTADAGTYSVEVKAVKGNRSATAKGTFSLNTEFITETEGSTVKVPVIFRNTRFVCNKCGRNVFGEVRYHISPIDSTELREKYADSLYTYKYNPKAGKNNGWVASWSGDPDVMVTSGYYDFGDYYWHPVWTSNPDLMVNHLVDESLDACMPSFFSLAELEAKIRNCGDQDYINLGTDYWLNRSMSNFHAAIEGCSSAYHTEDCITISGLQEIVIPATGYTRVSLGTNQPYEPLTEPPTEPSTETPVEELRLGALTGLNCKVISSGVGKYEQLTGYGFRFKDAEINQWQSAMFNVKKDGLSNTAFGMECSIEYSTNNGRYDGEVLFTLKMDPDFVDKHIKKSGDLIIVIDNGSDTVWYPAPMTYAGGTKNEVVYRRIKLNDKSEPYPQISLSWNKVPNADSYSVFVMGGTVDVNNLRNLMVYSTDVKTTSFSFTLNEHYASRFYVGDVGRPWYDNTFIIYVTATRGKQSVSTSKTFTFSEVIRPYNADDPYIYTDRVVEWK